MNFTIALLAGLVLLLPGLTALVGWNVLGVAHGARRPELQLTSVTALLITLSVAVILHVLGFALVALIWSAALELGGQLPQAWVQGAIAPNPYEAMVQLALGGAKPAGETFWQFLLIIVTQCLLAWRLFASEGLDLVMEDVDVRAQGWVFQHIVRPARHGYKPIAYVLTTPAQGEYGIGYEGVIADIRQGDNGEIKSLSLAEPQRFVYHLMPARGDQPRFKPRLAMQDREWIGGVVALDGSVVRNIVVHNVSAALIAEVTATLGPDDTEPHDDAPDDEAGAADDPAELPRGPADPDRETQHDEEGRR
ncbi:hypothetical protein BH10PSE12_BH10PSE12_07920 [soil metagenome]